MPKLKSKSKSSSRKKKHHPDEKQIHRHHHHHHHHHRHHTPPIIYDDDNQGNVPPPQAFKTTEEQEWQEKLFEAMVDEEDPFYTFYNESNNNNNNNNNNNDYSDNLHHMTDDAYADYIRNNMYRKRYAEDIVQQEARRQGKAKRQREKEQKQEEHRQFIENIRQQDQQRKRDRDRQTYTQRWDHILQSSSSQPIIIHRRDIPWPIFGSRITKDNVRSFMVNHTAKELRQEQLRYHPDKFIPRMRLIFNGSNEDMEWIQRKVNDISGWLNELWSERNRT